MSIIRIIYISIFRFLDYIGRKVTKKNPNSTILSGQKCRLQIILLYFTHFAKQYLLKTAGQMPLQIAFFVAAKCRHVITDRDLLPQFVGIRSQIVDGCRNRALCLSVQTIGCRKMSVYDYRLRFVAANVRIGRIHSRSVADKWRNPLFTHDSSILHANNAI